MCTGDVVISVYSSRYHIVSRDTLFHVLLGASIAVMIPSAALSMMWLVYYPIVVVDGKIFCCSFVLIYLVIILATKNNYYRKFIKLLKSNK